VETEVFRARVFWLGRHPLEKGKSYKMKLATAETRVTVQEIEHVLDTTDLSSTTTTQVDRNQVGEVVLRARRLIPLDEHTRNGRTGRFVLIDGYDIAGGGIISMDGYADQRQLVTQRALNITRVEHGVPTEVRERQNGHKGGVLWFTGLSGAGKSTLATRLERALFDRGYQTYVLDGDNIRFGLNANLGFSPEERAENIRRVGEVAALFSRAGLIAITAFISPYRSDRERARRAAPDAFHEVYIHASLEVCEQRDPKGLYARARTGEIPEFTGISSPYEAPDNAQLTIRTDLLSVEDCLSELVGYVEKNFATR
jgi:bifunctional enzyme CysN/CysC